MDLKKKIYSSLGIFLAISIVLIVFLISPIYKDIKNNSQELIFEKQNIATLESKIESLEEFKKNYAEIKPNLEKIETLFADQKTPVEFISFLENTSKDCQISINISPVSFQSEENLWPSITFQISSTGYFLNFLKFLEKLESSKYLIKIQNLTIVSLAETEQKPKETEATSLSYVRANFLISVYAK